MRSQQEDASPGRRQAQQAAIPGRPQNGIICKRPGRPGPPGRTHPAARRRRRRRAPGRPRTGGWHRCAAWWACWPGCARRSAPRPRAAQRSAAYEPYTGSDTRMRAAQALEQGGQSGRTHSAAGSSVGSVGVRSQAARTGTAAWLHNNPPAFAQPSAHRLQVDEVGAAVGVVHNRGVAARDRGVVDHNVDLRPRLPPNHVPAQQAPCPAVRPVGVERPPRPPAPAAASWRLRPAGPLPARQPRAHQGRAPRSTRWPPPCT